MTFDVSPKCVWVRIPLDAKVLLMFSFIKSLKKHDLYLNKRMYVVKSKCMLSKMEKKTLASVRFEPTPVQKARLYGQTLYPFSHADLLSPTRIY